MKPKKIRPQTLNILPYRYEPTYTEGDLVYIRQALVNKVVIEDIFSFLRKRHPETSTRSFYRWIESVAREK